MFIPGAQAAVVDSSWSAVAAAAEAAVVAFCYPINLINFLSQ